MSTQEDEAWVCSDDGLFVLFRNEPQAIIGLCLFGILFSLSFHFFHNLGLITCCDCCNCDSSPAPNLITAQSPTVSPHTSSPKTPKSLHSEHHTFTSRSNSAKKHSNSPYRAKSESPPPSIDCDTDTDINSDDPNYNSKDHTKSNNNSSDKLPPHKPRLARKATSTDGTHLGKSRFRSGSVNKQEQKEMHKYRNAYAAFIIVCLLFLFFTAIGKFTCFDVFDVDPAISRTISVFGHIMLYLAFGLAMLIIFFLRLKQTFDHSLYQISRQTFRNIIIGTSFVPIFTVVAIALYYIDMAQVSFILCFVATVIYCGVALFLLYMFISRLRKVKKTIKLH